MVYIKPKSLCEGNTCHVSPDDFWQLQEIISSHRLIILTGGEFSVSDTNGPILIENVSNLTISGGESVSLIECSPQSVFGLYIKNALNVVLTGVRIRYCGFLDPLLNWPLKIDSIKVRSVGINKNFYLCYDFKKYSALGNLH